MNAVLDRIERELVVAVRRHNASRRRRHTLRALAVAAAALAALTAVGFATSVSPLDRLMRTSPDFGREPGTPRIDLHLTDPGGLGWTATVYVARNGTLAQSSSAAGLRDRFPGIGFANAFVIADNLLNGPVADERMDFAHTHGQDHYLLAGIVDARVRTVVVELGGERRTATVSPSVITLPVRIPPVGFTDAGRKRAARMPSVVSLRVYAATFTPDRFADRQTVTRTITTTSKDGRRHIEGPIRICISRRCGMRYSLAR